VTDTASFDLALGGVAMPFIIALINQRGWDPKLKGLIAFVACLGASAILAAVHGTFTLANWRDTAVLVTGASMVMYHALWKPSGIAPAVEAKTTIE
jgi:peptidoglycan/LPS O-acetylase OafA/YrhL